MEGSTDAAPVQATSQLIDQKMCVHLCVSCILRGIALAIAVIAPNKIVLHGEDVSDIENFLKGEKTDEQIKTLLDYYNSVTGCLGSFMVKLVEPFIKLFVVAVYLCFATRFTLGHGSRHAM